MLMHGGLATRDDLFCPPTLLLATRRFVLRRWQNLEPTVHPLAGSHRAQTRWVEWAAPSEFVLRQLARLTSSRRRPPPLRLLAATRHDPTELCVRGGKFTLEETKSQEPSGGRWRGHVVRAPPPACRRPSLVGLSRVFPPPRPDHRLPSACTAHPAEAATTVGLWMGAAVFVGGPNQVPPVPLRGAVA